MTETGEDQKRRAGCEAVDRYVRSGMTVGLGTGSTSSWAVRRIGELLISGELSEVRGIPTSERTASLAQECGIPLSTLAETRPDFTIDGADEISASLEIIKGRGGALLREKIVACAGKEGLVVIADGSKIVDALGEGTLPVEVEPFGWEATLNALALLGCEASLRMDKTDPGQPFVTDGGHYTVDCVFPSIPDPMALESEIKSIPGALECGLFIGIARAAVVAREGGTEIIER